MGKNSFLPKAGIYTSFQVFGSPLVVYFHFSSKVSPWKSFLWNLAADPCLQVVLGHHCVVVGFLNAKYRYGITSFRWLIKVFVFWWKSASMPPGYSGGEYLWSVTFRLIAGEKITFNSSRGRFRVLVDIVPTISK